MTTPHPSDRLTLTLRARPSAPLELYGVTPDKVANLSAAEVARLPILYGNRRDELGQFFDVTGSPTPGQLHLVGDTGRVKGIGAGMFAGAIHVESDVGPHAGAGMTGGVLTIGGNAGDWLGAEMEGGRIEVGGAAGHQVGAAYRGSRRGMTGGTILIRGEAGDEVGLLMRRGVIAVGGRCGQYAGASMIAGSLFLVGGVGPRVGAGMKRGTIVTFGPALELPPSFRFACRFKPSILAVYAASLRALSFPVPSYLGESEVDCFRGDLLTGGRGEVFLPAAGV